MRQWLPHDPATLATTLAVGTIGALLATLLHLPAPYLTGPAALVTLVGVMGMRTRVPIVLRDGCFLVIGTSMGTGVNPEILAAAANWPLSLVALSLALLVIFLGGAALLQRFLEFDRISALLAATPGHLSYILSLSADTKSDLSTITVAQSLRVLILTLLVPLAVGLLTDADLSMSARPEPVMSLIHLGLILALAALLGAGLKRIRLPAAFLMGGFVVSALSHGTGATPGLVPVWVAVPSFAIMGTLIGTRFSGISVTQILRASGAAAVLAALALVATLGAALSMHWVLGLPVTNLLIAYAPGGLETMAALSVMLDADPAFVAFHHAFRILLLTFLVPAFLPRTEPET
ncbi:AbrB family transcriptional regulator [Nioella aestuarii]|uniref:AbrB family transcriptional regulator n=1 Tax=Nioella aestuarii TaxID=1662864 RepID=UPI003D7FFF1F